MTKYNATYWCSWGGNRFATKDIETNAVDLAEIPEVYNTIIVSFIITDDGINPVLSNEIDIDKIKTAQSKNQKVLISIGGERANFKITTQAEGKSLQDGLIDIIKKYNFDGLDIDIEGHTIENSDPKLFGEAVLSTTEYFRKENPEFMLTSAPEFPNLREVAKWYPTLFNTINMDNITVIWPQFYNQGGDGVHDQSGAYISALSGMSTFLAVCTWAFTTDEGHNGNSGFIKIPKEKFALGIPASNGASGSPEYVTTPTQMKEAYTMIKDKYKTSISGFMNWSADFDAYVQKVEGDSSLDHTAWETGIAAADILDI